MTDLERVDHVPGQLGLFGEAAHDQAAECWRPVVGWEDRYEVSDQGRVRSLPFRGRPARIRRTHAHRFGYRMVDLYRDNGRQAFGVHVLVARAFHGEPEPGQEVRHLNAVPDDNRATNLAWGTHLENMNDIKVLGRDPQLNKVRCPAGHPYDETNTARRVYKGSVSRRCRECHREQERERYARKTRGAA